MWLPLAGVVLASIKPAIELFVDPSPFEYKAIEINRMADQVSRDIQEDSRIITWNTIPQWINYVATNPGGIECGFSHRPHIRNGRWTIDPAEGTSVILGIRTDLYSPMYSLKKRPEGTEPATAILGTP
jgi:hypothetical protein